MTVESQCDCGMPVWQLVDLRGPCLGLCNYVMNCVVDCDWNVCDYTNITLILPFPHQSCMHVWEVMQE